MNDTSKTFLYLSLYCFAFVIGVTAFWLWQIKRRREKPPLEFKLLRGPGESLRRRIAKSEEHLFFILAATALLPIVAALAVFYVIVWINPHMPLKYGLAVIGVFSAVVMFFAARYLLGRFTRNRNDFLGYLGERAVGESLAPLLAEGYRVFHDIPAEVDGRKFNVDHVAVGPNGVFAVETKTRRKGRARTGFEVHKVAYDGRKLIWPWAEDSYGLKNAEDRARWLGEWINRKTGLAVSAQPLLVLPGWYVVSKGLGAVTVVNHKQLASTISRRQQAVLSPEQIDLIARQLDERCRDVED